MRGAVRWLACVALIVCAQARAQTYDATKIGKPADLSSATWRFAVGDDPDGKLGWADPAFDDSQWKTFSPQKSFKPQGYAAASGMWWLRLHVRVAPGTKDLAMTMSQSTYEIYINGRLIGRQGGFPDHPRITRAAEQVYSVPAGAVAGDSMVIAIRTWWSPVFAVYDQPFYGHMLLGDGKLLRNDRTVQLDSDLFEGEAASAIEAVVALMLGVWALALFRAQPGHREYLWLGVKCLAYATAMTIVVAEIGRQVPSLQSVVVNTIFEAIQMIAFVLFVCAFLRVRVNWWIRAYCIAQLCLPVLSLGEGLGWWLYKYELLSGVILFTPANLFPPLLAIRQLRRGDREAGALLLSLLLLGAADYAEYADLFRWVLHGLSDQYVSILPTPTLGRVSIPLYVVSQLLFDLSIGAIMLHRSIRITREQQRTAEELEAARSVQTFLLGREASAPGFTVESAYLPAQEVGGDFFQTIAGPDGSLLAVIGDVAGKGLQAAMRVSMLIGAVRLSPNESPAALLRKLNGVLLQDGSTGFATCLAARLDAGGTVTIANAGHLSPYINGQELTIDGGLPLGVADGIDYSEQTFPFAAGDKMLLMSDGVVEARNPTGELFGFERMAQTASSVTGADSLAATAKAFGQDDDITVLLLQRAVPA